MAFDFETWIPVFFIAFFVLSAAISVTVAVRAVRRARANLLELAQKLGLEVIEKPARPIIGKPVPTLAGNFRGREMRIYSYATGSGKSRTQWVAISARVRNPGGYSLRLSAENFLTRAGRTFGVSDVEIGDREFDRGFYVKSNDAAFTRVALIPEVRQKVAEAWENGARGTLTIEADEVKYAEVGAFARRRVVARFPALVEVVCDFCEIAEAYG